MTTLEILRQEIADTNIRLDEFHLPHAVSMSHMDEDGDCFIAIDRWQIATSAEEEVRLLHEMGHCKTGSFYCEHTAIDRRGYHENKATRWAIRRRLPIERLRAAIQHCRPHNDYELAEHLGLTVEFVRVAIQYYTETLGLVLAKGIERGEL